MKRRACLALLVALPACGADELSASEGWIRAAPPGATALAGYVTLRNQGATAVRCASVKAADFGAAELHRTVVEDGVSRMLRGQVIEIAPGAQARLAPGGLHIMLFRPSRELRAGDRSRVTLDCGDRQIDTELIVKREN